MINKENVWFITGCSTGFGREIAKKVIAAGYKVAVTARNKSKIKDLIVNNEENALALILDVTDKSQVREAVKQTVEKFGRIDILVNNAGIGYFSSVEESIEEQTRRMFEINFWGLMDVTNTVLPYMRNQKSGHIINFSSIAGLTSSPTLGYYNATKYAVEGISESLVQEVSPLGIKVTLIEPSGFRTDWYGRSSVKTELTIEDYKGTVVDKMLKMVDQKSGQEKGDPEKAAQALIAVVESENPPYHLLLGKRAYQAAYYKIDRLKKDFEEWKEITINADFKNK